ncbi:hypothetical protein ABIE89_000832 [Bradyrhizobium niftali]|uniref:CHAT domain-containing protein n=1 Tax=Bradyrhizobium niftali TaxID=2560055 RepID=UPI003834F6BC
MNDATKQDAYPAAADDFDRAIDLFRRRHLEPALRIFVRLAESDEWFERCSAYILEICSELLRAPGPADDVSRLRDIETSVISQLRERNVQTKNADVAHQASRDVLILGHLPGLPMPDTFQLPASDSEEGNQTERPLQPIVERTPHMDLIHEGALGPGAALSVKVWLDVSPARTGEIATNVVAPAGTRFEAVLVASSHFEIEGSDRTAVILDSAQTMVSLPSFKLKVVRDQETTGEMPCIIVVFFAEQRACGKIARIVEFDSVSGTAANPPANLVIPPPDAPRADLVVTIIADPPGSSRQFVCLVSSPHLEKYRTPQTGPWSPGDDTSRIVAGFMDRFTSDQTPPEMLTDELRGAGKQLFTASPKNFQQAFWDLIDANAPLLTIAIVSEEAFFPWELMVPRRIVDKRWQERNPLGVDFGIGRWIDPDLISPAWSIELVDSFVVAPRYSGAARLASAEQEAEMVLAAYGGRRVDPATFGEFRKELLAQSRSLIHFVCHGESSAVDQTIRLEDSSITTTTLLGIPNLAAIIAEKRPLVFLNACEIGRLKPALVGVRGFASAFIELGAAAVIAPLWSVDDGIAHQVARAFYEAVKNDPDKPFSLIISQIRDKAYAEAKDTFAAYCFFGDPLASIVRPARS